MHIAIVTPLFPPDIGDPAPYVKELSARLATQYSTTTVLYGRLPESVAGAKLVTIDKRAFVLLRLWRMLRAIMHVGHTADVLYVQNGPSTELPTLIASYVVTTPIVYGTTDPMSDRATQQSWWRRRLAHTLRRRATATIDLIAHDELSRLARPDTLPFPDENDTASVAAYHVAWQQHLDHLRHLFSQYGTV